MDMSQYMEMFIEESKEHLQGLNQSLLQLEKTPGDSAVLNEVFRIAHTLKGMSATMGFSKVAKLTHDMENILHAVRSNEVKVTSNMIDTLFKCLDALENYINQIINTGSEGIDNCTELISELEGLTKVGDNPTEVPVHRPTAVVDLKNCSNDDQTCGLNINQYERNLINKANEMGLSVYYITVILDKGCVLKSARAFVVFQVLERISEVIKSEPVVKDIEDEMFEFEFSVLTISKENQETINKELNSIAEIQRIIVRPFDEKFCSDSSDECSDQASCIQNMPDGHEQVSAKEKDEAVVMTAIAKKQKTGKTVRVDIDRLDVLMNLVSELIIIKTRLEGIDIQDRTQIYNEAVEYLERITTNLHDAVMKVRMVPVETVFNRFPRMIRDISRELGKEITLDMSGEETELDRTVIDEIGDPLIHLLRNSVDHGIEAVQKRREAGKSDTGCINLRAYQDGNNVVIEVEDDGRGIDIQKVKMKAIEAGLINREIADSLSRKDVIEFLFKPSFSTADKVTDLSGRGVGLDVVKTKIEALGGIIEVETESGKGSRFIIRLPLTLAIIQALLVLIGNEKYAIPLNSIREIIQISTSDIKLVQKNEVILLRNMVIPIVRLDRKLDIPKGDNEKKQLTAVIIKKGDKLSGFLVDSLIGQQEIVIKSLGKYLLGIRFIAGATILGDGNVALIIDVNSLA